MNISFAEKNRGLAPNSTSATPPLALHVQIANVNKATAESSDSRFIPAIICLAPLITQSPRIYSMIREEFGLVNRSHIMGSNRIILVRGNLHNASFDSSVK